MKKLAADILSEMKHFINGHTLDAILSPTVFILLNKGFQLAFAAFISVSLAFCILMYRLYKKQKWQYAVLGFIGIVVASAFALIAGNAKDYFLPDLISGTFFAALSFISLLLKKPLAAWVSHLTRGWPKEWYWRNDILPAYYEVTVFWTVFLFFRIAMLVYIYINGSDISLFLSNLLLGFPSTLVVLILTYIYGIWRLAALKGPGVDEFTQQLPSPWQGQKKGF